MPQKIDHLYQRPESKHWWLRLRMPADVREAAGEKCPAVIRKSLGTTDYDEAVRLSHKELYEHKTFILFMRRAEQAKPTIKKVWRQQPGSSIAWPDGRTSKATETQIVWYAADGSIVSFEKNYQEDEEVMTLPVTDLEYAHDKKLLKLMVPPKPPATAADEEIIQYWIEKAKPTDTVLKDTRRSYALFQKLCPGKTFRTATPEDAAIMADHLAAQGLKSRTVKKAIGNLGATINMALTRPGKFPKLNHNPFNRAVKVMPDSTKRIPINDDEMALMLAKLSELDADERLLWGPLCHNRNAS